MNQMQGLGLRSSSHYLSLAIFLLSISGSCHPHILTLQNQNVNLWADLSPLCAVLWQSRTYLVIDPFLHHVTERLIIHSIIPPTVDTHMCMYTQTHTHRGIRRKMIECVSTQHESTPKHKCQLIFQLNIMLLLPTQGALQAFISSTYATVLNIPELHTCTSWSPMEAAHQKLNYKIKQSTNPAPLTKKFFQEMICR